VSVTASFAEPSSSTQMAVQGNAILNGNSAFFEVSLVVDAMLRSHQMEQETSTVLD
jgi:hypothetical protein